MTAIYCAKCKEFTNTKSEKLLHTANDRYRLTGICTACGTKKGMFANKSGKFVKHTQEERMETSGARSQRYMKNKALDIGLAVIANNDAKECVKKYLPTLKWPRMPKD
jgi:hypothetical protein